MKPIFQKLIVAAVMTTMFLAVAGVPMRAQQTATDWQREAVRQFPELAKPDSVLNRMFISEVKRLKIADAQFFSNPQWPLLLARQCVEKLQVPQAAAAPGAAAGAGRENAAGVPPKEIKIECAYVEMSLQQADQLDGLLAKWNTNPSGAAAAVERMVWGSGQKTIAKAVVNIKQGNRAVFRKKYREAEVKPEKIPKSNWDGGLHFEQDELEAEATVGPEGTMCDVTFAFSVKRLHAHSISDMKAIQVLTFYNAVPVVTGRRDVAQTAKVLVARATWRSGVATIPTGANTPVMSGVRAKAFWVPPAFTDQAVRLAAEPIELMNFLRQRGVILASSYCANKSGQQGMFADTEEGPLEMTKEKGSYVWTIFDGVRLEAEPVLGAKAGDVSFNSGIDFNLKTHPHALPQELLHTKFHAEGGSGKLTMRAGAFACFRIDDAGAEKVKRSDVYVVFEGVDPRPR